MSGIAPIRLTCCVTLVAILVVAVGNVIAQPKFDEKQTTKAVVYDTGYEIIDMILAPSVHWIDNDRLLFAGMKAGRGPRPDLRKLYLWNASTKAISLYADAKEVCIADGIIRYTVRLDKEAGKAIVREGLLGAEREVEEPLPSKEELSREPPIHSNFTCKTHLRSRLMPPAQRFRHVVVLRKGDGYLDLEPGGGPNLLEELAAPKRNLVLYQATGRAIELPMTWDEQFSELEVTFSTYRKAYVLQPHAVRGSSFHRGPWPNGEPLIVYLVTADGKVQADSIPYSISDYYLRSPRPTIAGWIFGGGTKPATVGLYVFDGKLASKLDVGSVKEASVTPNGCKAAVAIQNKPFEMGTPTNLRVFDFCVGGR